MKFQIIWSVSAFKELRKLDRTVSKRIFEKLSLLADETYRYVQKLVGSPYFKLRVGDFRIILEIKQTVLQVLIIKC